MVIELFVVLWDGINLMKIKSIGKDLMEIKMEFDLVDEVIQWSCKADPEDINKWEEFVRSYLERWEWNDRSITDFINWGEDGFNNNNLHEMNSIERFYNEVEYASDRMSLDRLFRCHVMYRNIEE